jgi:hypothetical protein
LHHPRLCTVSLQQLFPNHQRHHPRPQYTPS